MSIVRALRWSITALSALLLAASVSAADWYVAPGGSNANPGTAALPFLTVGKAIMVAGAGDTVHVAAGSYPEAVNVTKRLTFLGAQSGVDARTRPAVPESIVGIAGGAWSLQANGIVLDGFVMQNVVSGASCGIRCAAANSGHRIVNNIIRNNQFGLYLNTDGTFPTAVQYNLFQANNAPGALTGNGIFTDLGCKNVLIDSNRFRGNNNASMSFAGATGTQFGITVSQNQFLNDNSILLVNVGSATICGNTCNLCQGSAVFLGGNVSGLSIIDNAFTNSVSRAVAVTNLFAGANSNVTIARNKIQGNAQGVDVLNGASYAGIVDATYNWWASASGPGGAGPGTGDSVSAGVAFDPWLIHDPSDPCSEFTNQNVAVGLNPTDIIAAEMNNLPQLDLVTANSGSDDLTVLFNNGAGVFSVGSSVTIPLGAGAEPRAIASGNFVAGGGVDLAAGCAGVTFQSVRIVRNSPVGTFAVVSDVALPGERPVSVVAGSFDGTGLDDLAIGMEGNAVSGAGAGVAVSLNLGPAVMLSAPGTGFGRVRGVVARDLDGDGDLDLAVTMSQSIASLTQGVFLYRNDGSGTFALMPGFLATPSAPQGICSQDMDNNGKDDLMVACNGNQLLGYAGSVVVFLHDAAAAMAVADFAAAANFTANTYPTRVACGDLDDDTVPNFIVLPDIVSTGLSAVGGELTFYRRYSGGSCADVGSCPPPTGALNPDAVVMARLSLGNPTDVAVANFSTNNVTVKNSICRALTQTFGVGCPGVAGIPQISSAGLPNLGNNAFAVRVTQARPNTAAILTYSPFTTTTNLGFGCTLYTDLSIIFLLATPTNGAGNANVGLPIPPDASLTCINVFFQWAILDMAGVWQSALSFSNALRIRIGS